MSNALQRQPSTTSVPVHNILLVEDEASVANGLEMVLSDEGYHVDIAPSGTSALDKFRESGFDLVVADLRLPDIDGLEVVRSIRRERPEVKVIIVTGFPSVSSAIAAVKTGVTDYLRKPFTEDEILSAVRGALKQVDRSSMEAILAESERATLIQRQEVLRALETAARDQEFGVRLLEEGSEALESFELSSEAKGAIISGDIGWIQRHVGELNEEKLAWLYRRLEREAW
jgi:YesN/AraC family two-component response regulator